MAYIFEQYKPKRSAIHYSNTLFFLMGGIIIAAIVMLHVVFERVIIPNQVALIEKRCLNMALILQNTIPYLTLNEIQVALEKQQATEPDVLYILLFDQNGYSICHSDPSRNGMFFGFYEPLFHGQVFRHIYTRDEDNPDSPYHGQKVIDINVPAYDGKGELIGGIGVGLSMKKISELEFFYRKILIIGTVVLLLMLVILVKSYYSAIVPMWRELTESVSRYGALVKTSPDGIVILGKDKTGEFINDCAMKMLGLSSPSEFNGMPYDSSVYPEDREVAVSYYDRCMRGEILQNKEMRLMRSDGTHFDIELSASGLFYDGEPQGVICIFRDVTERRKSMLLMRENESRYHTLFDKSYDSILVMDRDSVADCNQTAMSLFGMPRDKIKGMKVLDFSPSIQPGGVSSVRRAQEIIDQTYAGEPQFFEWLFLISGGRKVFCGEVSTNLIEINGKPTMLCIIRDISERKHNEAVIQRQLSDLDAKNTEMERFNYTVSHDLRSPIITIKGFLGTLSEDAKSGNFERMESDIKRISSAADKMQNLLENLRSLSRIGRIAAKPTVFSMSKAAFEAVELLHSEIEARGVSVEITPDMPTVKADETRIREVYQNLIENSVKFMGGQKEPKIRIGCRDTLEGPLFYVSDNGIGIEKQYHSKIFGLFDKLDKKSSGTGIGLSIVKRIIDVHNGTIRIESEGNNEGTTFLFTVNTPVERGEGI